MTNINYIQDHYSTHGETISTLDLLDMIKSPSEDVAKAIDGARSSENKKEAKKYKDRLPAFFCGNYTNNKRDSKSLISIDMMIFDFDKLEDVEKAKQEIKKEEPLLAFISPSGNGLKAIFEINGSIKDNDTYKSTYEYYKNIFKEKGFNPDNTSDCVRLCYLSCDDDPIYNKQNKKLDIKYANKEKSKLNNIFVPSNIDDSSILDYLLSEIAKNGRPDYLEWKKILFATASKVGKTSAIQYMKKYFPEENNNEYEKAFVSPLTEITFGSLFHIANVNAKEYYRDQFFKNKSYSILVKSESKQIKNISQDNSEWWYRNDKTGRFSIDLNRFFGFLSDSGYSKVYIRRPDKIQIIKKTDNIINKTSIKEIKDYIKDYIDLIPDHTARNDLTSLYYSPKGIISEQQLDTFNTVEIDNLRDTNDTSYFFYENSFVEIKKDSIKVKEYKELKKPIWSDSIIKRKIEIQHSNLDMYTGLDFYEFVCNINGNDAESIKNWECSIGYMLHRYKTKAITKAIIFTDREYSENADGRTGKSLSATCLKYIRNVVAPDGKGLKGDSPFVFQMVEMDTDILFINDAEEQLDFNRLYNPISDDWQIEKKNQGAIIIPFEISPKIIITTNYAVGDNGGSSKDRKHEVALYKYYSDQKKPEEDFGRRFFEDYDNIDWLMFDYYMIHCVQRYLSEGLPEIKNIENITGLKHRIGKSIFDFCEDKFIETNGQVQNKSLYDEYLDITGLPSRSISQNKFTRNIKEYLKEKDFVINDSNVKVNGKQGIRYFKKQF